MAKQNEEALERKKQATEAYKLSTKLMKNFRVYIEGLKAETRGGIGRISKEDYDKLQSQRFAGTEFEQNFFSSLPNNDNFVEPRTLVLTEENFALGFHPFVWELLNLAEKTALCRMARLKLRGKDFNEFCYYDSTTTVYCGNKFTGSLDIIALGKAEKIGTEHLIDVLNGDNTAKISYYNDKIKKNRAKYTSLTAFESFEEMRYLSPITFYTENVEDMPDENKALHYDSLYGRIYRNSQLTAYDYIEEHSKDIEDIFPDIAENMRAERDDVNQLNIFIAKQIGSFAKQRDELYLSKKIETFNNVIAEEYNSYVDKYNDTKEQLKNAQDMLESVDCKETLVKYKQKLKELDAEFLTLEQMKEHFKEHFYPEKTTNNVKNKGAESKEMEMEKVN